MAFLRFVVSTIDSDSGLASGVFQLAAQLKDSTLLSDHDRQALRDELACFNEHLKEPPALESVQIEELLPP